MLLITFSAFLQKYISLHCFYSECIALIEYIFPEQICDLFIEKGPRNPLNLIAIIRNPGQKMPAPVHRRPTNPLFTAP